MTKAKVDVEVERNSGWRGDVDPKLGEMFRPRVDTKPEPASNLWTGTDPNPAFLPREMPYVWPWEPKAFTDRDFAPKVIEVPMHWKDRVHVVIGRACDWLDRFFGAR